MRRLNRRTGIELALVVSILLAFSAGCSPDSRHASLGGSSVRPSDAATPSVVATPSEPVAQVLGAALEYMSLRPVYTSDEPRGAVGDSDVVFVSITSVTNGAHVEVSFDAEQFYQGPLARVEASKDGVKRLEGDYYIRNKYRHVQTLPVATDAVIVLQADDAHKVYGIAPESGQGLEVVSPAEFATLFAQPFFQRDENMEWVGVDNGKIDFIFEQFLP